MDSQDSPRHPLQGRMSGSIPGNGILFSHSKIPTSRILIELMLMKGWYLVYPNFPSSASFSTNYFELGVHSVPEGKEPVFSNQIRLKGDRRFTVPLIKDASWRKRLEPISSRMISQIPWVNLQHRRVNSRQDLFVPKTVFMRNHLSSELQEYLAQL